MARYGSGLAAQNILKEGHLLERGYVVVMGSIPTPKSTKRQNVELFYRYIYTQDSKLIHMQLKCSDYSAFTME